MTDLDHYLKTLTSHAPSTLRRPRVRVQVVEGPDAGKALDFSERVRIGARPLAELVVRDPRVSGLHCEIVVGDVMRLRDLGSKNGTRLGGYDIFDVVLPAGEPFSIGGTTLRAVPVDELVEVPLTDGDHFHGIVGHSPVMRALTADIARLAQVTTTVLVEGETGTGKEGVAEALHLAGPRRDASLVIVDCGSIPANLVESELFGHERGAFTGAVRQSKGAFQRAHGGTLFLDEIGELPLDMQTKLLRVLESGQLRPVGADRSIEVDVRVVAATNRDLAVEVTRGRFREDLYYRLAVVRLALPPLRERRQDIALLAVHLLRTLGHDPAQHLTVESLDELTAYDWPGNVRELRNTLERAAALLAPPVVESRTPAAAHADDDHIDLREPLRLGKRRAIESFERAYVKKMLLACKGNVSETARRSGMDRMSIRRIVQRDGLAGDE